ncbi:hypothetical protein EYC98_05470 [Halieaceae bacterium IMCC14734]|uniref:Aerotolerance regulator N-terminal domain-containing protein n=1 Tax=Candidatus Litorirhabdus singularis TaxID=2518993 RepID=A0ABT3TDE0_9GAMM|nr:hypothetical protein [Candidatus Litorirhabdus singularis]MCX2980318.1 hypothetical protein [Candidatus Litorirhabdus singularis]
MNLQAPLWLWLIPALLAVLWWLHRHASANRTITVSALELWPTTADAEVGQRRPLPDRRWLMRALLLSLLSLCLTNPSWPGSAGAAAVNGTLEISSLTLKRDYVSGNYSAMFSLINHGDKASTIELELRVDGTPQYRESITVAAAANWSQQLQLEQAPLDSLQLSAVKGATTRIQLTTEQLLPVPVLVAPACGQSLRRALQTHPGLRIAAGNDNSRDHNSRDHSSRDHSGAVMAIACAGAQPSTSLPTLLLPGRTELQPVAAQPWWSYQPQPFIYLDGTWLQRAVGTVFTGADEPLLMAGADTLLARRAANLVSALDLESSVLAAQPTYPLLITELLDQLTEADLRHGSITAAPVPVLEHSDTEPERPLTPYLLVLCLLMVGSELWLSRKP